MRQNVISNTDHEKLVFKEPMPFSFATELSFPIKHKHKQYHKYSSLVFSICKIILEHFL